MRQRKRERKKREKRKVKFLQGYPMRNIILARETAMCTLHTVQVTYANKTENSTMEGVSLVFLSTATFVISRACSRYTCITINTHQLFVLSL